MQCLKRALFRKCMALLIKFRALWIEFRVLRIQGSFGRIQGSFKKSSFDTMQGSFFFVEYLGANCCTHFTEKNSLDRIWGSFG